MSVAVGSFLEALSFTAPYAIRDPAHASFEADLWSLGITMIVVLTGEHPYPQRNGLLPLVNAIMRGSQPALDSANFPPELCRFVTACLNQPQGDATSADRLLHHPFLLAAKERGIVSEILMAKLSLPCPSWQNINDSRRGFCQKVIEGVLQWQLDEWGQREGLDELTQVHPDDDDYPDFDVYSLRQQKWLADQLQVCEPLVQNR
jgi:serine/threonine protein kinase